MFIPPFCLAFCFHDTRPGASARVLHVKQKEARRTLQPVKKVPSSRHVRMDGTHTGKFGAESVRGCKAECAVQCQILSPGGSRAKRVQWTKQRRHGWRSAPVFASAN